MQKMFFYKIKFNPNDPTNMSVAQWEETVTGAIRHNEYETAFFNGKECFFCSYKNFKVFTLNEALRGKVNHEFWPAYEQNYDDMESYGAAFIYDVPNEKDGKTQILISEAKRRIHMESIKEYMKCIESLRYSIDKCVEKVMKPTY